MNIKEIQNPKFLKEMNYDDLNHLAFDIREFIINNISKTGGHLASNLGAIELTIAIHKVFNAPNDKILFDVGHQSYTHKILTGRAKEFETLREFGGLSGFQKRKESIYDCFEAGHSSTALSTALGMTVARDLSKDDYEVIAVVGDGSISSGLSLEALNEIGDLKKKMIIVFNDNQMSINKNVGALSKNFVRLRSSKAYTSFKIALKNFLKNKEKGNDVLNVLKTIRDFFKNTLIDSGVFGEFGLDYIGPIDGHDIEDICNALNAAKSKDGPVVVHLITKKGYGYKPAENDESGKWHGVKPFNIETGEIIEKSDENYISYSKLVANTVETLMRENDKIVTITPAMISGSSLENIFKNFKDRAFDVGITEDNAICFASGLSLNGYKPFVSIYSSFLQRAYDQINHDICRMNLPCVIGIDRADIVGEDGETHQGVFDISFIRPLPNAVLCQGKNSDEIINLIYSGFKYNCPFFIRYPRGVVYNEMHTVYKPIKLGSWEQICNNKNHVVNILTYGNDVIKIRNKIENDNLPYNLYNCRFIKPIDTEMLSKILKEKKPIIVYTNSMIKGGLGDDVLEFMAKTKMRCEIHIIGVDDVYVTHGSTEITKQNYNLDLNSLYNYIKEVINA